jgi:hypothetical protein
MWSFLNPLFLYAAIAAVIPLVLHLMQRRRTVRIRFSTVRFLRLAQKRSSSRIRMENFLLWLLRTLLMLALALAFAIPVLRTQGFGHLMGSARRDVAVVLDVSYSMGYESGRRKVWDTARDAAVALIEGLNDGDRVCVFLADERNTPLIEQPTGDRAMVINLVKNLPLSHGTSHLHEALMAALKSLEESKHREREVHLITDGQSLPWRGFEAQGSGDAAIPVAVSNAPVASTNTPSAGDSESAAPPAGIWDPRKVDKDIVFFALLAGPPQPENTYPVDVELIPPLLLANAPGQLNVRMNHSGPAQSLAATLEVDGKEVSRRTAVVDADGALNLTFALSPLPAGVVAGRIYTPADGLSLDDEFHFLLRVRRELPTLVVGSQEDCLFLATALNPGDDSSTLNVKRIDPDTLPGVNLRDYSTLFLVNVLPLPGQTMLALENYVKGGGVLVVFPGDGARAGDYDEWTCLPGKPKVIAELPENNRVRYLFLKARQDPIFEGFSLPPGSTPTLAIQRYLKFDSLQGDQPVVIGAGNDIPFLTSRYFGRGRVLLFSVSADRRWSTLPLSAFFLPLVHQIVLFGAGIGREPLYVWPARSLVLSDLFPDLTEKDTLLTPAGEPLTIRPIRKEMQVLLEAENVYDPGVYTIARNADLQEPFFAVNLQRAESNLKMIDPKDLPKLTGLPLRTARDGVELQRLIDDHRRGKPLSEMMLWLALILSICELFLANWVARKKSGLSEHMNVESSGRVVGGVKE